MEGSDAPLPPPTLFLNTVWFQNVLIPRLIIHQTETFFTPPVRVDIGPGWTKKLTIIE